jgi:hypothetical protein
MIRFFFDFNQWSAALIRSRLKLSDGFLVFIKWIVGATIGIESVESGAIVRTEGQSKSYIRA